MLLEKLKIDQVKSRKAHLTFESKILTTLIGEIVMVGKNVRNGEPTEEETLNVLKKFLKGANETINMIKDQAKILDLKNEILIYESYLPDQLTEDQLLVIINDLVKQVSDEKTEPLTMRDMGYVISLLKEEYENQYDPKVASALIKGKISL